MTTFSQLVDDVTRETRRPDLRTDIIAYLNQTLRECHFLPSNGQPVLYPSNMRERVIQADVETGFGIVLDDPGSFQAVGTVRYDSIACNDEMTRYPPEKTPGRGMIGLDRFYYRAGNNLYFAGYGGVNGQISLALYYYPRRLKYYELAQRPANYDSDFGWQYTPAFDSSDELRAAAESYTSNWLLMRWLDVVSEGLRAKIYKRLSDTERARTCFSQFTTLRAGLSGSEMSKPGGFA